MANSLHAAATQHLPSFITPPGETDVLMVVTSIVLLLSVVMFGHLVFTFAHSPRANGAQGP